MFTPVKGDIELLKFALSEIVAGGEDHFNDHSYSLVGDNNQGFEVSLLEICEASMARITELEQAVELHEAAETMQIALREKAEEREQALAAHVDVLRDALNPYAELEDVEGEGASVAKNALAEAPSTSLDRLKAMWQAEAMRHVAGWLSGEIDDGYDCIGHDLGGEISGPTGCSSADKCRVAGERIFKEAARVWEYKYGGEA
ncbi:hypothetical protein [Vreelandella populi]|uniref:Uncharacterized protein n=1 Tax=Vreelandella populi TaxID=2498858 RepID=A0A433LG47_9GAMM|nr:hypothetical protein [Halomonas populi]RUR48840.1 hypothetical protein ELY37_03040 [Halomonas populi]